MSYPIVNPDMGTPTGRQYPTGGEVEPTNTDKPVNLLKVAPLAQNTLLGKFSGDTSEAK